MRSRDRADLDLPIGLAIGVAGSMLVAFGLSSWRGSGPTVPALALMVVVIAAAGIGGRTAGIYSAVVAALSYNFWHTRPYHSLRIHDAADVATTVLLLVAGVMVGALAAARERHASAEEEDRSRVTSLSMQADLLASGASVEEIWSVTRRALVEQLDLEQAWFEPFGVESPPLPRMTHDDLGARRSVDHSGRYRFGRRGYLLPPDGVEVAVVFHDDPLGRLVLVPGSHHDGASVTARRAALALAEQLACAMATGGARPLA